MEDFCTMSFQELNYVKKTIPLQVILITFLTACSFYSSAQTSVIKGKILDANSFEPLIGASVRIEGTTIGAASDLEGNFTVKNVPEGDHNLIASYVSYIPVRQPVKAAGKNKEIVVNVFLNSADMDLAEFEIVAKANRESESILLIEQKQALIATQAIGANELSRKGIGDAGTAVTQVVDISRQEGVKNVFVRGLGDRYNITLLNGFPVPSEDPEYKNISLDFFGSDVIQNIKISKVFAARDFSDVSGAVIDISSKELFDDQIFSVDISAGMNTISAGKSFLLQDGSNYFGYSNSDKPDGTKFTNSLDPIAISFPFNHSYGITAGKYYPLGKSKNSFSVFLTASHSSDDAYREEIIRNTTTNGTVWQDQTGNRFSKTINQLVLANAVLGLNNHIIKYNFMLVHANDQYVGEYNGYNSERHQDSPSNMGILIRQQTNDNMLFVNQLITEWKLAPSLTYEIAVANNNVTGLEPDRRVNYFSLKNNDTYDLTRSNRNKRFFSELRNNDFNARTSITYKIDDNFKSSHSSIRIGYNGRFLEDSFEAIEYNFSPLGMDSFTINNLLLDDLFVENLANGRLTMAVGQTNSYAVTKYIHSGYSEFSYQLTGKLSANAGLRVDMVNMTVNHDVQHVQPGNEKITQTFILPSLNLKYDVNSKNSIRFGASKTYTLPHSKEISPYQYVNISFASQGNPNIVPSKSYNLDLKWDFYLNSGELLALSGFYKHISNPIGRVDQGNSAGLLTYENISDKAQVSGAAIELRKNIFNNTSPQLSKISRLTIGLNASYIFTKLDLKIINTPVRNSMLEGASPFITNIDLSYNFKLNEKSLVTSILFNYFSDRIHTIGAKGFNDIIEEGFPTLDFASSLSFNKHFSIKAKVSNILNSKYILMRKNISGTSDNDIATGTQIILNEYQTGQNISLGISYTF